MKTRKGLLDDEHNFCAAEVNYNKFSRFKKALVEKEVETSFSPTQIKVFIKIISSYN